MELPLFVHRMIDWWERAYWVCRATWFDVNGRRHYLRDAPDHVIAFFVMLAEADKDDEAAARLGQAAASERALRRMRGEWDSELDSEFNADNLR